MFSSSPTPRVVDRPAESDSGECLVAAAPAGQTPPRSGGSIWRCRPSGGVAGCLPAVAPVRSGVVISRAALARQVRARIAGVSGGIASRSRCKASSPVSSIVCASPVHQSSRTVGPPTITSSWGQEVHASAFNAMRRTTPSRSATASTRAGNSVIGSRDRGHHPPSKTSSALDGGENASRTRGCAVAAPGHGTSRRRSRAKIMSALLPPGPQQDRNCCALTLGMPQWGHRTPGTSHLKPSGDDAPGSVASQTVPRPREGVVSGASGAPRTRVVKLASLLTKVPCRRHAAGGREHRHDVGTHRVSHDTHRAPVIAKMPRRGPA